MFIIGYNICNNIFDVVICSEILQSTKRVSRIFSRKRKSLLSKSAQSKTFQIDVEHQIEVGTEVLSESYCEDCEDDDDEGDEYSDESDIEVGRCLRGFALNEYMLKEHAISPDRF